MNHLFIQTAFLGDLLLSVPILRQIRYWSPQAKLTLICRHGYGSLMRDLGLCDEVIEVSKKDKIKTAKKLSQQNFHTLFCPHQSYSSHKMVAKLKAEKKIGYKKFWNGAWFDARVERRLDWPEAIRQLQLLAPVYESMEVKLESFAQKPDSIPSWAQMSLPNLHWSDSELNPLFERKAHGLKYEDSYICIAPGSVWPTKRWTREGFIKAATSLARQDHQIVIIGAKDERELCELIQKDVPNSFNLAGQLSILESIQVLSRSAALICNDSGAMHMASLLNLPTVAIFGATVLELGYKPWNPKAVVVDTPELLCRPCGQHGARHCPITTLRCMTDIKPEWVVQKVKSVII